MLQSALQSDNSEAIWMPIKIKPVHSSLSYRQVIYQEDNQCGCESSSGYGPVDFAFICKHE